MTEEVSFTAVPANRPKPVSDSPMTPPRVGKIRAASTLNRKITEMDWAISSSSASITGAVAAMAEPPQMEDPTPMSVAVFPGTCSALDMRKATIRAVEMVHRMMGRLVRPTWPICRRFSPKPRRMTAYCSTFLEVKATPSFTPSRTAALFLITAQPTMPMRMASTAEPITSSTGSSSTTNQATRAMARQSPIPGRRFSQTVTECFLSFSFFTDTQASAVRTAAFPPVSYSRVMPSRLKMASSRSRIWAFWGPSSTWSYPSRWSTECTAR